jgi:flagellar L-ring protein precursor FlgH
MRIALLSLTLLLPAAGLHAQAPTPPAATPAAAAAAQAPAPAARTRQSWTSPRRSFGVGDVVTVLVDDYTLASANTSNTASDSRRRDLGLDARTPGGGIPMSADVGTRNDADSRQRGEAVRQNRFQSEMSVRVVAIDSTSGLLKLEGTKLVDVDKNRQEIRFTGWVRPQDVSAQNSVDSWRVANAELLYTGKGPLGKPKGGIIGRVLGMVWP